MAVTLEVPPVVRQLLAARLEGVSRTDLAKRAAAISEAYRADRPSHGVIASDADALAYAVVRMPATFAAVRRALATHAAHVGLEPHTLLDIGAGPGTATLAALAAWPTLTTATLFEPNRALAALAKAFTAAAGLTATHAALDAAHAAAWPAVDVAVASYVLVELDAALADRVVTRLAAAAAQAIVLVEPGTMPGFARIRHARDLLIAAGWTIAAPCPHDQACPLASTDWCHFSVRVQRSRDHLRVKGADVPYEDEPYSFVVATRTPTPAFRPRARILRPPQMSKAAVDMKLCDAAGLARDTRVAPRDPRFKAARKAEAGDPW